ncbi:hypothetical protein [Nocardia brasiliensis]|uniref:hypothetical protein n=1 Tax=Nocardia brasiliensis TaxID=37326 RepID=UPI001EECBA00|nr:hypothetical protein [Nocardia brasiliensis]
MTLTERTVNGQPGLVALLAGTIVSVYAFDVEDRRITRIWVIRNPEKLRAWTDSAGDRGSVSSVHAPANRRL